MFVESARVYDALYEGSGKSYDAEAAEVHALIQRHRPGAASLADIACGTGQHLFRLKRHYACRGLDLEPAMVAIARARNPDLEIVEADMRSFDLGRTFDAVVCLFSSIGYMPTVADLHRAIGEMTRHLAVDGVLLVESFFEPQDWILPHVSTEVVERAGMSIVRMNSSQREGSMAVMDFHHLVGTADGVEHFKERHELRLFTRAEHEGAFAAAGLEVTQDPDALLGRGLYIGRRQSASRR